VQRRGRFPAVVATGVSRLALADDEVAFPVDRYGPVDDLDRSVSGASILARVSCPLRQRNAERVYSADARDLRLDLNRG
jgi:hypothetical protein